MKSQLQKKANEKLNSSKTGHDENSNTEVPN
jgi:hypothetical protein